MKRAFVISLLFAFLAAPAAAQQARLTIFDLHLGSAVSELPPAIAFKGFACGSDGGPPGARLAGWAEYGRCTADHSGLHEVYFEYDDEAEYIARAHDDYAAGWHAGTAIDAFPIIASALFNDTGRLVGLRIVTDPRPDAQKDPFLHFRPRLEHYLLALYLMDRFGMAEADCRDAEPAGGEGAVLGMFVKRDCDKVIGSTRYTISSRLLRRPGETDLDPATRSRTEGAFRSETRAEIRLIASPPPG